MTVRFFDYDYDYDYVHEHEHESGNASPKEVHKNRKRHYQRLSHGANARSVLLVPFVAFVYIEGPANITARRFPMRPS